MGLRSENIFFAEGLQGLKNSVDEMNACSQEPTTYTEAVTTFSLGDVAMVAGDFTEADNTPDGRKLTVAAKTINGDGNGNANHLALVENAQSTLWYVSTTTLVGMEDGVDQSFSAFDIAFRDPTEV